MGTQEVHAPVKFIASIFSSDAARIAAATHSLERRYGPADFHSELLRFDHTEYYLKEMGAPLFRSIVSFRKLRPLDDLYKAKIVANRLERVSSKDGRRTVNIDPGYVDLAKLVLFSTKDYTHRIHIRRGIYAEVTLYYKDHSFNGWPWTYPDYKSAPYLDIFEKIRGLYKKQISQSNPS